MPGINSLTNAYNSISNYIFFQVSKEIMIVLYKQQTCFQTPFAEGSLKITKLLKQMWLLPKKKNEEV